jgi:hypothetical protein
MREWKEPVKILADILSEELELPQERVFIANDGRELPKDDSLYIVLTVNNTTPFGSNVEQKETSDSMIEIQSLNFKQTIIVSLISKNSDARTTAYEVINAISSLYSIQQQEKYACHIARLSPINDVSFLENTARLSRFDVAINMISWKEKRKTINYMTVDDVESRFES